MARSVQPSSGLLGDGDVVMFLAMAVAAFGADERVVIERPGDGSVQVTANRQQAPDVRNARELVLDFGEASLFELALFFADLMQKNLLLTNEEELRRQKVLLRGHDAMTAEEAWQAFLVTLRASGFAVDESAGLVRVVPAKEGPQTKWRFLEGIPDGHEGLVTSILPLENAQAGDVATLIQPLLSPDAMVKPYAPGNRLIVTDTASNIAKVAELVESIDWAAPKSTVVRTPLRYADAEEVRSILLSLYPVEQAPTPRPQTRTRRRRSAAPEPARLTAVGEQSRQIEQILADARTNSLVVLANAAGHEAIAEIVADLDIDADPTARKQLHVLELKFAMADELLSVLKSLQSSSGPPERKPARPADESGRSDITLALDDDVRLASDPATNALVVVADPVGYAAVASLVERLDAIRGQVFIDAVFVELTHTGGQELGLEAQVLPGDGTPGASLGLDPSGGVSALSISPDVLSGLAAGVFGSAIDVVAPDGTTLSVPRFGIALRALQTRSDIQVMGNPSLLTLDHNEAELNIGQRIPYPVNNQLSQVATIQTFQREDVGTKLVVTPHINSESLVTMDVALNVEEVEGAVDDVRGPTTSQRSITSRVMVETGQTIVMATSLSTRTTVGESKVPFLGDLPLIGALFRGRREESRDSQLMVFLTPTVVTTPSDLIRIRKEKEAQRAEFVRRFQGKSGADWLLELQRLLNPDAVADEVTPLSRREARRLRKAERRAARERK